MKVVLSVDALSPQLTGIGRYVWELVKGLSTSQEIDAINYCRGPNWVSNPQALLDGSPSWRKKNWYPKWAKRPIFAAMCANKVVHGPNYFLPPGVNKGIITVHDLSIFKYPHTHPQERLQAFEKEFFRSVAKAVRIITVSESVKSEIVEFMSFNPADITVVPLGVAQSYKPREYAEVKMVLDNHKLSYRNFTLCVSTIEPRKNIDLLIKAYALIPKELRLSCPLVLIGASGWLNSDILNEIEKGKNEGWLVHLGFVSESDLQSIFSSAKLFVYPSKYEGFGLPVAEAMASGVPVITSPFSSLPEVSAGAALLIDPSDIEILAEKIQLVLEDEVLHAQMTEAGIASARRYNWDYCIKNTLKVYKEVDRRFN